MGKSMRESITSGRSIPTELTKVIISPKFLGLDGTYRKTGMYLNKNQEDNRPIPFGLQIREDALTMGIKDKIYLDNPFLRMHEKLEQNPHHLDDMDDVSMIDYDNWERFKPFTPKKGTTVGETNFIPLEDNDQKPVMYDLQGENMYTNPPDSNIPSVDHRLDEEHIWSFGITGFNQSSIKNHFSIDPLSVSRRNHMPQWGQKLIAPSFYTEEKFLKLVKQHKIRLNFSNLQAKQAFLNIPGDQDQKVIFKEEIKQFLNNA